MIFQSKVPRIHAVPLGELTAKQRGGLGKAPYRKEEGREGPGCYWGAGGMPGSNQDMKLRGVVVKTRFKRIWQAMLQSSKKISVLDCSILDFAPSAAASPISVVLGDLRRSACSAARQTV